MNKTLATGRLTRDLDAIRYTQNNKAVITLPLALSNGKDDCTFCDVTVFGNMAEACGKYLKKGSLVSVEFIVKNNNYQKDGKTVYGYKFIATNVSFLGGTNGSNTQRPENNQPYTPERTNPGVETRPAYTISNSSAIYTDDIDVCQEKLPWED